jgi:hypothetical protein
MSRKRVSPATCFGNLPIQGTLEMLRPLSLVLFLLTTVACEGNAHFASATPAPTPTTFSLTGQFTDSTTSAGVAGATASVADGVNAKLCQAKN